MASNTSVTSRAGGVGVAAAKQGPVDLAKLVGNRPLATKEDLAALLKSGVAPGVLAYALLSRAPATKAATSEFALALAEQLKTDKTAPQSGIDELQALAKTLASSDTAAKTAVAETEKKVDAAATAAPKTASQRERDQKTAADGQKELAKASKGLGFDVTEQPAKADAADAAAAPAATPPMSEAALENAVNTVRGQLQQIDDLLQSMPPQLKRQAADAMNGYPPMPPGALQYTKQADAAFQQLAQMLSGLPSDDQRAVYEQFGINVDMANAAAQNGGAKKTQTSFAGPTNAMTNSMNTKGNPAIGSRINPLDQTPILQTGNQNGGGIDAPDTRTRPPIDQLRAIIITRLGIAGGRYNYKDPTPIGPINWANPQENPDMARFHASIGPQQTPTPRPAPPALRPMPGGLEKMADGFGLSIDGSQMEQLLAAAKKAGVSADTIADQIISNQGPFAQLAPRLGYGMNALMSALDTRDPAFNRRAQGLQSIVSAAAAVPPGGASTTNGMSGAEMAELLKRGGSPLELAKQILSGNFPMQNRLTAEALGTLHAAMDPSTLKTKAEGQDFLRLSEGLMAMMQQLPPGPASVVSGAQWGLPGSVPFGGNAAMTGALATMGAGFIPTGNTAFDLANAVGQMPTYSPAEQALLNQIQDPQQRAMQELQMFMQKQALLATTLSNLANMRHEMMKTVANNLRG